MNSLIRSAATSVVAIVLSCSSAIAAKPVTGELLFNAHCAVCHTNPATKAPPLVALRQVPFSRLLAALEFGKMQIQASQMSASDRQSVAKWLALAEDSKRDAWIAAHSCPKRLENLPVDGNQNWGFGSDNARFIQSGVAISAENIDTLALQWTLAVPQATDMRSQPVAAGDTLFLGTQNGNLLALDQASGCVRWHFRANSTIRSGLTLAAGDDKVPTLYFADDLGSVYGVDARIGRPRWTIQAKLFPTSVISGSLTYSDGMLFVPISSFEVAVAGLPTYACCRSHGGVIALDAASGMTRWVYHTTLQAGKTRANSAGVQNWGPSGASVWSTPTVDTKRRLLYFGSGENLSLPATSTSDAVIAVDLDSGVERWHFQALANDVWNGACQLKGPNCPENPGPDWDIGASIVLTATPQGKEVLLVGQKSGEVFALDPEKGGKVLWRRRLSQGTANGGNSGVHWGMASDGTRVYAPVSDPAWSLPGYTPRPGIYALDVSNGEMVWEHRVERSCIFDPADAPLAGLAEMRATGKSPRSPWPACSYFYAHSAAALLANGVVYAGALDGKLRALRADDGQELRVFETAKPFQADNGITGHGGSLDVGGVIAHSRYLFIVSGYSMFGQMPGNMLLAYALPHPMETQQ